MTLMEEHRLTRTGDAPLVFRGELLHEESGAWHGGKDRNRWLDLSLYRTAAGQFVLERVYRTRWAGESDEHAVIVLSEARGVVEALRGWDPGDLAIGYPPGTQFAAQQARLLDNLRAIYRDVVAALLDALPGAEERIE